ncbi:hypothetical protein [Aeromonas veronii]|uniref:hypothetical protein n=1 Tax=Aeromonas veronii TaxID=654 RepID=UPI0018805282|nr:hypothetical protein [Aeromonas veronii]MBE8735506.1 hypothetical protein [Aeromonas veronii]MBE8739395.1 hypothetical protein [Aeromonas veronii]MBE8744164.1 hypothetical protein [Aeromonas veronii]MBE8765435.1 hypothetical protein [Aeromonas veronii]MBE8841457.1 hypothetical protein [Aeromonas veronii]
MELDDRDIRAIRDVISSFKPESASSAARALPIDEIYVPSAHRDALDFDKPLVVGNRGTGKSVWSGALADSTIRKSIAKDNAFDTMATADVELGFHQSAAQMSGIAPSPRVLNSLLIKKMDPEVIWTAVLLKAVSKHAGLRIKNNFEDLVTWVDINPGKCEKYLIKADEYFTSNNKKFLLVFDALDRLGKSWETIRPLTRGILSLTLTMQGYSSMRAKVFMRTDQFKDSAIFNFPDASKIKAARIDLNWHPTDLYGLFFQQLRNDSRSRQAFAKIYNKITGKKLRSSYNFQETSAQRNAFSLIAGEYMGADHRRGRTYTWIVDHLADAFHETTPRSFLVTLQRAASARQLPSNTVIDHHGIREGVQSASAIRVDQLSEDYPWIRRVLEDLAGLEVPCLPHAFITRWSESSTVDSINSLNIEQPGPVELLEPGSNKEELLLQALVNIGVVEYRSEDKINMPDIFRVAAKIKRRGGVKTPSFTRAG